MTKLKNSFHNSKKHNLIILGNSKYKYRFTSSLITQSATHQTKSWFLIYPHPLQNPPHSPIHSLTLSNQKQEPKAKEKKKEEK